MTAKPNTLAALVLFGGLLIPAAGARADAAAGERLAQQWCANCHVVGAAQATTVPQGPPTFRTIAGHLTPDQLRTFLTRPHPPMPDLALTRAEIDDLVAYIETLK